MLGGGSSINFMAYVRPSAVDYDEWDTEGWSSKDMIQLARKLENYHPSAPGVSLKTHGSDGPINVSDGGFRAGNFEQTLEGLRAGAHKEILDLMDFESADGFSVSASISIS